MQINFWLGAKHSIGRNQWKYPINITTYPSWTRLSYFVAARGQAQPHFVVVAYLTYLSTWCNPDPKISSLLTAFTNWQPSLKTFCCEIGCCNQLIRIVQPNEKRIGHHIYQQPVPRRRLANFFKIGEISGSRKIRTSGQAIKNRLVLLSHTSAKKLVSCGSALNSILPWSDYSYFSLVLF